MQRKIAFEEIEECIMNDARPSERLRLLVKQPWFKTFPFDMILKEQATAQSPVHHPEGSVWEHTVMVVDEAAMRKHFSTDPRAFMWAALLHDIGKPETTKVRSDRVTAYNHDRRGAELAREFFSALTDDTEFISKVEWLIRYHMQILYAVKSLPFLDVPGIKEHTNVLDVALLSYCDRLGRDGVDPRTERKAVIIFLEKCHIDPALPWL